MSLSVIEVINVDPYVRLDDIKELLEWNIDDEVLYNQQIRHAQKLDFFRNVFDFIRAHSINGDYFEFGSHKCRTFRMALTEARKKNITNMNFLAFDSFEGLPAKSDALEHNGCYSQGLLSTGEQEFLQIVKNHGLYLDSISTYKGYFEDSLTAKLKQELLASGRKISFVTLDCSFYESFSLAFAFIEDFLQDGSIVYVDDFRASFKGHPRKGPARAFREFEEKSSFMFEPFLDVGWFGKSFIAYKQD